MAFKAPDVYNEYQHPVLRGDKWVVVIKNSTGTMTKEFPTKAEGDQFIADAVAAARRK